MTPGEFAFVVALGIILLAWAWVVASAVREWIRDEPRRGKDAVDAAYEDARRLNGKGGV